MNLIKPLVLAIFFVCLTGTGFAQPNAKKITIQDIQGKVQTLTDSVTKTIGTLKKSNESNKNLDAQIELLTATIETFESQVKAIEDGGEIYDLTTEAQAILKAQIVTFEEKIQSGTLTPDSIKGFESLIERVKKNINGYGDLIVDMSDRSSRLRSKIKDLKSNKELVVATLLVNDQELALKQLKECLKVFDDIEKDIDSLKKSSAKLSVPE